MSDGAASIATAEARLLSVAIDPKIVTANYDIPRIGLIVVRLRDEDGVEGFSCLWFLGLPQARVVLAMLEYLGPLVVGKRAADVTGVVTDLRREINFLGFKGVSVMGLSAFDMALHDMECRRRDVALSALLTRRRESVPVYWSSFFLNQTVEEMIEELGRATALGFRALKFRPGKPTLAEDVARVEALLEHVPAGTSLMLDAQQAWTVDEAIAASRAFAAYDPIWLEDPLVHADYRGLRRVVEEAAVPIATGENEYLREGYEQLFESGCPYLLADMQRVGGLREWLAVADEARGRGRVLVPHIYPQVGLQLMACLDQQEVWMEYVSWWDQLMTYDVKIEDGQALVPDVAGLGFDFDPDELDRHAVGPWQSLHAAEHQ